MTDDREGYWTPDYVLEYAARQVGVDPEVLRNDD